MKSNEAYASLGVIPPGQGWFAFDVPMPAARRGHAKKFAMTIWNYHSEDEAGKVVRERGVWLDSETGTYWYRVPRDKAGQHPHKRKSLWDALHIAARTGLPMQAMLKDRLTKRSAPDHVFPIGDVRQSQDGSVLWLRIDAAPGEIGTEVETKPLPALLDIDGAPNKRRSAKLTEGQYTAAAELADAVYRKRTSRAIALEELQREHAVTAATASVLLNDYRCLIEGDSIKAPISADAMAYFVDHALASHGDGVAANVISALGSFIEYARSQWDSPAAGMRELLYEITSSAKAAEHLIPFAAAGTLGTGEADDADPSPSNARSEILREIWVRGPQHTAFKRMLLRRWNKTCCVHGVECNGHIRASHIVPWSEDKDLRGDVNNGLLLSAPLDSLFDAGLISFSDDGVLVKSHKLDASTALHFGLQRGLRLNWDHLSPAALVAIRRNLDKHRKRHARFHPYAP